MKFTGNLFLFTIGIIVFILVSFPFEPLYSNDYVFHYNKSIDNYSLEVSTHYSKEFFYSYVPLSSLISRPFSLLFGMNGFNFFWFLFLFVFFPLTLYYLSEKNIFVLPLYFSTATIPFFWHTFTVAQLLMSFFFVLLVFSLLKKNYYLAILLAFLCLITHKQALWALSILIPLYIIYLLIEKNKPTLRKKVGVFTPAFFILGSKNPFRETPFIAFFKLASVQLLIFIREFSFPLLVYLSLLFLCILGFENRIIFTAIPFLVLAVADSLKNYEHNEKLVICILFITFVLNWFF